MIKKCIFWQFYIRDFAPWHPGSLTDSERIAAAQSCWFDSNTHHLHYASLSTESYQSNSRHQKKKRKHSFKEIVGGRVQMFLKVPLKLRVCVNSPKCITAAAALI